MKRILAIVVALAVISVPLGVVAHNGQDHSVSELKTELQATHEDIQERRQERASELEERSARRCEFVRNRLSFQAEHVARTFEYRSTVYQDMLDRLNTLALRAENNELEATELRSAIVGLSQNVADFEADYTLYLAEVKNAANTACSEESSLRSQLSVALSALRTSRADAQDIREYVDESVDPALESLREEVVEQQDAASDSEAEATQDEAESSTQEEE